MLRRRASKYVLDPDSTLREANVDFQPKPAIKELMLE